MSECVAWRRYQHERDFSDGGRAPELADFLVLGEVATVVEAAAGVAHDRGIGYGSGLPFSLVLRIQRLHLLKVVLQDALLT